MEFDLLSKQTHLIKQVPTLVYETDTDLFKYLFGSKEKAIPIIEKLIRTNSTSFSKHHIFIATKNDELVGMIIGYKGDEINKDKEKKELIECLGYIRFTLFILKIGFISSILTMNPEKTDFYISNICVDKKYRGQGIGAKMLKHIKPIATEKKASKIILDVSTRNTGAKSFYQRNGFQIQSENKAWYLPKEFSTITMKLQL